MCPGDLKLYNAEIIDKVESLSPSGLSNLVKCLRLRLGAPQKGRLLTLPKNIFVDYD
jgi:hypothetical protein